MERPAPMRTEDDPTTRLWTSGILRDLKRSMPPSNTSGGRRPARFGEVGPEPQDGSSIHAREEIRSAILAALESAASSPAFRAATASTSGIILAPNLGLAPQPPAEEVRLRRSLNPFLQAPGQTDPPAPWLAAYGWSRWSRHRRQSNVAIAAIVMALAIGLGLVVDHARRSGRSATIEAGSRIVLTHAAKAMVPHRR